MRQHTSRITGSLSVSGSGNVDFTSVKSGVSGSFRLSDIKASLPTGTVSSSAQIDAQISASFAQSSAVSASFAQKKAVTGSFALKATISGSYLGQGVVTSSAQLATDISGSLGANASLIRSLTATGVSGSLGTNASLIRSLTATAISGSVVAGVSGSALSTGSFGKLEVGGNSSFTGDLTVGGRLTAQEFHTEFVSSSIMFQSGSTKFGDSAADTHTFTGKMEISGSQAKVSASVGATGSFGHLFLAKGGHVTDRLYFSDVGGEYISGSLGANASLIRSLTAVGVSGSLGANASLIRSLTAVGITGSFTALSASITTRIAAEEAEAEGTVVSSSAQIASDISGSLGRRW